LVVADSCSYFKFDIWAASAETAGAGNSLSVVGLLSDIELEGRGAIGRGAGGGLNNSVSFWSLNIRDINP